MNIVSLKEYAKQKNISYEAVRQQVVRYKDELEDHIIKDGKQQFLDEEAVAFLDAKRQKNPVAIIQQDKDDTIRALEEQIKLLLTENNELLRYKADNAVAIAEANHRQLLLENKEQEIKLLEGFIADAKEEINVQTAQNDDLRAEIKRLEELVAQERETAEKASEELSGERQRRISFKEFWSRRK